MSRLDSIRYITLPKSMEEKITGFAIDSSIPIPVQLPDGHTSLDVDKVTLESIVAGMLVVIAYKENDRNIGYYRDFVLAAQPNAVEELNTAAIAKEHQKDYPRRCTRPGPYTRRTRRTTRRRSSISRNA